MDGAVVALNVGGQQYTVGRETLAKYGDSQLSTWFSKGGSDSLLKDKAGNYFVDRDGQLFQHVLHFIRNDSIQLPSDFKDYERLLSEFEFFKLADAQTALNEYRTAQHNRSGYLTVAYQGTLGFGKAATDVNFRKVNRILVCGRVSFCREAFGEALNEGRDPDRGQTDDRYTSRFFLKHSFLEQAFDSLNEAGFKLMCCSASSTNGLPQGFAIDGKAQVNSEEDRWAHYTTFIFHR